MVSSSVHWRSNCRNTLDQRVKSGDLIRSYTSRGRDSSYFGLFIAFGLLSWAYFGTMLMAWDGFVTGLKGCFRNEFGLKNCIYRSCQNAPATLGHTIAWIDAIVWLLVYSNFGRPYLSRPNFDLCVLRLYENLSESRI